MTLTENADTTVATMTSVAAGSYAVFAKTTVVQTNSSGGGGPNSTMRCTLDAGGAYTDYAETELGRGDPQEVGRATLAMNVTAVLDATGSIVVRCHRGNNSGSPKAAVARETKIITIEIDTVTRAAVSG